MTIGQICNIVGGGTPDTSVKEYWNGDIQWFTPSEVGKEKYVSASNRTISINGLKNSSAKLLPPYSILLSSRATVGECSINLKECCTNQGFQSVVPHKDITSTEFLYYRLLTHKKEFIKKACGSTFLEISAKQISKLNSFIPSRSEQEMVAALLSLIDERISIQNKVIEDLKSINRTIINRVFSSLNATTIPLCEVASRITERNVGSKVKNVLTISARDGLVSQLDFFNKSVASSNLSQYFLLKRGDFAYNKSYSSDYPWGAIKQLEFYDVGVLSPLYFCFRPNKSIVDISYLQFYFSTNLWHKHIAEVAVEGARNHGLLNMSISDFMQMPIPVPDMTEQLAISQVLKVMSDKLNVEEKYTKAINQQKQYLLGQLFV